MGRLTKVREQNSLVRQIQRLYITELGSDLSSFDQIQIVSDSKSIRNNSHTVVLEGVVVASITARFLSDKTAIDYLAVHSDFKGYGFGRGLVGGIEARSLNPIFVKSFDSKLRSTNPYTFWTSRGYEEFIRKNISSYVDQVVLKKSV